jgi:hypothetical protein
MFYLLEFDIIVGDFLPLPLIKQWFKMFGFFILIDFVFDKSACLPVDFLLVVVSSSFVS